MADQLRESDLQEIKRHGLEAAEAHRQLELFRHPPPPIRLVRPCRADDGVLRLSAQQRDACVARYEKAAAAGRFSKLVPASGAASRMFHALGTVYRGEPSPEDTEAARRWVRELRRFAFHDHLVEAMVDRGQSLGRAIQKDDLASILDALLGSDGLDYGNTPKGLIPFHRYPTGPRTAIEEHLVEAAELLGGDGCQVHFTIPQQQELLFRSSLRKIQARLGSRTAATFEVSCSNQAPETDTLAADPEGAPFRRGDGHLLFRPGGHGALLTNLERCRGDLVFVKNIDNILPDAPRRRAVRWKKILGGLLLEVEEHITTTLARLASGESVAGIDDDLHFLAEELSVPHALDVMTRPPVEQAKFLVGQLDRPLRVCGMVVNEGEPGGGPFWVRDAEGRESIQIVESSQIDRDDPTQQEILAASTHFNPVDLVCRLRSAGGEPYALADFVDENAVFLSRKSHQGRALQALERPGLWNGAMARWNTVFVEVPAATFAPVKTVFDLLRPEHQPEEG